MADNLRELLDIAKRELPEIPPSEWARIERLIRQDFGGQRPYIARQKKRARLEVLAQIAEQEDIARVAQVLGVGVRRAQQLKKLA